MTSLGSVSSALVTVDRQYLYSSFQDGVRYTLREAFSHDNHYVLFRYEDWPAWATFSAAFVILLTLDNWLLNRKMQELTIGKAVLYTLFWIACACGFCGWVYWYRGESAAFMWMSGYMLEWMLSFDNLFVFHLIFSVYGTPDHLKHRPLYFGIWGAILFRLAFIFTGEYLMHAMFFIHLIFGSFLIFTGVKTVMTDDDEDDPSKHPVVQWLQRHVPFVSAYDQTGAFFVRVPLDQNGEPILPSTVTEQHGEPLEAGQARTSRYGTLDFGVAEGGGVPGSRSQIRATMLFLVVCCIEFSDLLFAVDSVSAIVAQVNDLFLAYTSAVFAMLGLRATFFIIDVLAKVFSLLKYGVAAVLVFIGIKLCLSRVYHIPASTVCAVLVSCIAVSMIASVVQEEVEVMMAKARRRIVKATGGKTEQSPLIRSSTL
jgi:tellurite resistance protein TerC